MLNKNILLGIAFVLIVAAVWYLQSGKVSLGSVVKGDVLVGSPAVRATSTDSVSGVAAPEPSLAKTDAMTRKAEKAEKYQPAHEIVPGGGFINSDAFKLKDLIGKKVILLDFWTYSCINCQRTTPYLNAWYEKYKDHGLVIVEVHTPEFDFEKVYDNVAKAVQTAGIKYPVVQDNNYATWQTYENRFWPHEYLIDIDGYIVHDHIGEGGYDETERAIQAALKEREQVLGMRGTVSSDITNPVNTIAVDPSKVQSHETYFGAARNEYLGNGTREKIGLQELSVPAQVNSNTLYLSGTWDFKNEYAQNSGPGGEIVYTYNAKNVYLVASADTPVDITVVVDGAVSSNQTIKENKLYPLVQGIGYGEHTLEIRINTPGLMAYTFTFG